MTPIAKLSLAGAASLLALGASFASADEMSRNRMGCTATEIAMARSGQAYPECARYAMDTTGDVETSNSGEARGGHMHQHVYTHGAGHHSHH